MQHVIAKRIEPPQWYASLINDMREIACDGIVGLKHAMGKRMLQDIKKFGKPKYGSKKLEGVAKELGIQTRELNRCIQFAKKSHSVTEFKGQSWRTIVNKFLPSGTRTDKSRKSADLSQQFDGVDIRKGNFIEVLSDIEDGTVKLILTDPPYGKKHLDTWGDLSRFARRVLRPDGILIAYSGQMYLPCVIEILSVNLQWWWMCGVIHKGSGNLTPLGFPVRKVINQFKPLLMFIQDEGEGVNVVFRDLIEGAGPEKDKHNWQQPVEEARVIIETFCSEGDLVVDPFAGSGSFGEAANQLGMPFIGAEILETENE